MQSCEGRGKGVSAVAASSIPGLVAFTNASTAGFLRRTPFRKALQQNPDVAASRAGALPFRNSFFIGNYNSQQRGTELAVSAFQLLGNTLSVGQRLSSVSVAIRDQTLRSYQWTWVTKQATSALVGWEHIQMIQTQFSEYMISHKVSSSELVTPGKTCDLMIFSWQNIFICLPQGRTSKKP